MAEHKLVDGIQIPLSAEEIAQRQAEEIAWNNGAFDRSLASLRKMPIILLNAIHKYCAIHIATRHLKSYCIYS